MVFLRFRLMTVCSNNQTTNGNESKANSWVDKANEQAATESRDQPWKTTLSKVVDTNPAGKDLVRMGDDKEMQHSGA